MRLSDIKVSNSFKKAKPNPFKIKECLEFYQDNGFWNKELYVDKNGYITDGYVKYIVAQMLGLEEIPVRIGTKKHSYVEGKKPESVYRHTNTCYIYGKHPNVDKEYVWRVPAGWHRSGWEDNLKVGDLVSVNTKYGVAKIIVTRIETHNVAPVDYPIKKVTGWKKVF